MDQEHRYQGKITGIYPVADPKVARKKPFLLALDEAASVGGRPGPAAHQVLVSAAARGLVSIGDQVELVFRDAGWDTELAGLWRGSRKIA